MDASDLVRAQFERTRCPPVCAHDPVADLLMTCRKCGMVLGPILVTRYNHDATPLYIYCRVSRFAQLLYKLDIKGEDQMCVWFEALEAEWKTRTFKRRYFLNLRFCAWHLALLMGVDLRVRLGPCIKDPNRIASQVRIFKILLRAYDKGLYDAYCSRSSALSETTKAAPDTIDC